jgi:hypothetical protein
MMQENDEKLDKKGSSLDIEELYKIQLSGLKTT